eukprot:UN07103
MSGTINVNFQKKTPPNIYELTPLSVNFQKKTTTKNLLEKPFSAIVFCKGMFEKNATKHLRIDTLTVVVELLY